MPATQREHPPGYGPAARRLPPLGRPGELGRPRAARPSRALTDLVGRGCRPSGQGYTGSSEAVLTEHLLRNHLLATPGHAVLISGWPPGYATSPAGGLQVFGRG